MGEANRRRKFKEGIANAIIKWKEVNPTMELKVIFAGGATLVGELEEIDGKKTLKRPRAIALGVDPQGRQVMALQQFIGEPESVEVVAPSLMYDVRDEKVIDLYIQATTGLSLVRDLSNVRPIRPGSN
jgi:hypothetical protein